MHVVAFFFIYSKSCKYLFCGYLHLFAPKTAYFPKILLYVFPEATCCLCYLCGLSVACVTSVLPLCCLGFASVLPRVCLCATVLITELFHCTCFTTGARSVCIFAAAAGCCCMCFHLCTYSMLSALCIVLDLRFEFH